MSQLTVGRIWLFLADQEGPMNAAEIAKALKAEEAEVLNTLQREPRRFELENDGRWSLTAWKIPHQYPFLSKAELVLWYANFPVPEDAFLRLLSSLHPHIKKNQMLQVLNSYRNKFTFDGRCWSLTVSEVEQRLRRHIRSVLERKKEGIRKLLARAQRPLSIADMLTQLCLHDEICGIAKKQRLNKIEREKLRQICKEELLEVARELLKKELQKRLEELKKMVVMPFASCYAFYDPETFIIIVEKGESIEVGSEKERWLKEKGFYEFARFGCAGGERCAASNRFSSWTRSEANTEGQSERVDDCGIEAETFA